MAINLTNLEWLSPTQALKWLQVANKDLTREDMMSLCVEGRFLAYVRLKGDKGVMADDPEHVVYGSGHYAVLNPDDLVHGKRSISLLLQGDVLPSPDPEDSRLRDVAWTMTTDRQELRVLFKRAELDQLKGGSVAGSSDMHMNHLVIISALVEMLKDQARPAYNQDRIIKDLNTRFGHVHGLGETTLRALFGTANKVRKSAKTPPPGSSKIRLDKSEIQLD
ncbi:hypothetical protein NVV93_08620 [Pseudomonas sp. LS44]|uniref:hypothetical protein n=1 Tax=Pseudomonas sp. LS44 TaxID=1357074 RepID=UPI00215A54BD|nr:hypothetical protein [Pseudomonas sp. LS44]UVE19422.1 hypothetical protein NVV93_08620 [Pseudomonas sp. LS44]